MQTWLIKIKVEGDDGAVGFAMDAFVDELEYANGVLLDVKQTEVVARVKGE